jgi:hypothetical protein
MMVIDMHIRQYSLSHCRRRHSPFSRRIGNRFVFSFYSRCAVDSYDRLFRVLVFLGNPSVSPQEPLAHSLLSQGYSNGRPRRQTQRPPRRLDARICRDNLTRVLVDLVY